MKRDSLGNTIKVALLLSVVCSLLVSVAAVGLRGRQNANKELERKKNILIAAGLYDEQQGRLVIDGKVRADLTVRELFQEAKGERPWVETKIINLDNGKDISSETQKQIAARFGKPYLEKYDQKKAANDPTGGWSDRVAPGKDVAGIKRREKYSYVYLVHKANGELEQVILPIRGYGLWSTLWGFIALDADLVTIRGITYYEHGETPGLGGEVDNPDWKAQWDGKQAFDDGEVKIRVIKGAVDEDAPEAEHKIDGLSGATITSRGVTNMLQFWLGEDGFGPFLEQLRKK